MLSHDATRCYPHKTAPWSWGQYGHLNRDLLTRITTLNAELKNTHDINVMVGSDVNFSTRWKQYRSPEKIAAQQAAIEGFVGEVQKEMLLYVDESLKYVRLFDNDLKAVDRIKKTIANFDVWDCLMAKLQLQFPDKLEFNFPFYYPFKNTSHMLLHDICSTIAKEAWSTNQRQEFCDTINTLLGIKGARTQLKPADIVSEKILINRFADPASALADLGGFEDFMHIAAKLMPKGHPFKNYTPPADIQVADHVQLALCRNSAPLSREVKPYHDGYDNKSHVEPEFQIKPTTPIDAINTIHQVLSYANEIGEKLGFEVLPTTQHFHVSVASSNPKWYPDNPRGHIFNKSVFSTKLATMTDVALPFLYPCRDIESLQKKLGVQSVRVTKDKVDHIYEATIRELDDRLEFRCANDSPPHAALSMAVIMAALVDTIRCVDRSKNAHDVTPWPDDPPLRSNYHHANGFVSWALRYPELLNEEATPEVKRQLADAVRPAFPHSVSIANISVAEQAKALVGMYNPMTNRYALKTTPEHRLNKKPLIAKRLVRPDEEAFRVPSEPHFLDSVEHIQQIEIPRLHANRKEIQHIFGDALGDKLLNAYVSTAQQEKIPCKQAMR